MSDREKAIRHLEGMLEKHIMSKESGRTLAFALAALRAEEEGRCVVLPCKPNDAYWHRNYCTGQLELNFEMHEVQEHDDTYRELNCSACWE